MAQTVPLTVRLGAANTGLALGYRILNLDRTVYSAFTITGVVESTIAGTYSVDDGAVAPDAGGYVVWGTSGSDRLEGNIDPMQSNTAVLAALTALQTDVDALGASNSITLISSVVGDDITVYRNDTWEFTSTITLALTSYEAVAFVVKNGTNTADNDSLLYIRSDTGMVRMNGATATSNKGTLTVDSATVFSVLVDIDQTDVTPGTYQWWLKVFDTTPTPDKGKTIASGKFMVKPYGLRAIA